MFQGLYKLKEKNVEVLMTKTAAAEHELGTITETGIVTNILVGQGENAVFVELNNRKIINVRYIIKIEIKD